MGTRGVEVGKVGRVGLVEVVVDLEERGAGTGNDVTVERAGAELRGGAEDVVVDDGVKDAVLQTLVAATGCCLRAGEAYCPHEWHVLHVEDDKDEQQDARRAAGACEKGADGLLPVDTRGGVASRSKDQRHAHAHHRLERHVGDLFGRPLRKRRADALSDCAA